jgi:hypothetical protein
MRVKRMASVGSATPRARVTIAPAPRTRIALAPAACAVAALVVAAIATPALVAAPVARAVILPAQTIDGPSEEIVGFGGVAMAEDGTGGAVYLKRDKGVPHVFVSRFVGGQWLTPVRVDNEQEFAASFPRIGAAEGGRLVVVWATPFATEQEVPVDELLGATLGPGASQFGAAQLIDPDIREAVGLSPDLAVSSTGKADVVYRVVFTHPSGEQLAIPILRPGDVIEDVRVAHYNGERWSRLGAINRDPGVSMRPPSRDNAPRIAIGPTGNGVVAWQEPDIDGTARIWARRIFGATVNYVMPVTAMTFSGAPLASDADAPAVAVSLLGQADVAYRQTVGPGSPLPGPRIFLNTLPDGESSSGDEFTGPLPLDLKAVAGGATATVGPPNIDADAKRDLRLLYDANGAPRVIEGNDLGLAGALTLGPNFGGGGEVFSASVMNPAGGGISAWPSADAQGHYAVAMREDFAGGAVQTGLVSGGDGGPISELAVARSGLGDGIVGFLQGSLGSAAVVAARATAPPVPLPVDVPKTWVRPGRALVSWLPASSANEPLTYQVVLDGHPQPTPAGALSLSLDQRRLGDGHHRVQVLATDRDGQSVLTPPADLRVDGEPPTIAVSSRRGHLLSVRLRDPFSGINNKTVSISFGDGAHARGRSRFAHRYARAGVYAIVVVAADRVGNRDVVRRLVSVR